jgi:small multidrug resistance family-3 protein
MKIFSSVPVLVFLIIATALEVSGDAALRLAIFKHSGLLRLALFVCGAVLLFGYGTFLNLAPLEFGQVVGLYIATLFVMWQIINFAVFRELPTLPILAGGALIVSGGLIVSFWKTAP